MRLEPQELTTEQAMSRLGASMQHAAASMGMSLAQFGKAALEVSRAFKVPDPDEKMVALMSEEPVEDLTAISAAAELWKSRDDLAQQMAKAFGTNKPADLNVYDSKVCVDSVACYWREDNAGWELLVTCSRMGTYGSPGPIETQFVIHRILAELEVHQFAKEVTSWKHFVAVTWMEMAQGAGLSTERAKLPELNLTRVRANSGSGGVSAGGWYTATGMGDGPLAEATRAQFAPNIVSGTSGVTTLAGGSLFTPDLDTPESRKRAEEQAVRVAELKRDMERFWAAIIKMNRDAEQAMLDREEQEALEILRRTMDERPDQAATD